MRKVRAYIRGLFWRTLDVMEGKTKVRVSLGGDRRKEFVFVKDKNGDFVCNEREALILLRNCYCEGPQVPLKLPAHRKMMDRLKKIMTEVSEENPDVP